MAYAFTFTIPRLPPMNTAATRRHWSHGHREAKLWREEVILITRGHRPPAPLQRARITLTRRSSTRPDPDNLQTAFKPVVDALTRTRRNVPRADVLWDDDSAHLDRVYLWEYAPPRKGGIRVRVEEVAADSEG